MDIFDKKFLDDPEAVMIAVKHDGKSILKASAACKESMPLVLEAVNNDPSVLADLSETQRNNPVIVKTALLADSGVEVILKRNFVLECTQRPGKARPITHMGTSLKQNRDFMLDIVTINGLFFYYAHPDLKKDKILIFTAIANNYRVIEFIPNELLFNRNFLEEFFEKFPYLKDNYFFALSAVTVNANIFQYLSVPLRDNKTVLISTLHRIALNKQSNINDLTHEFIFSLISERLKQDKAVIEMVVGIWPSALKDLSETLRNDRDILILALSGDGLTLNYASATIQDDLSLVQIAIKSNGLALRYASPRLRQERIVVNLAMMQNSRAFEFASREIQMDKQFNIDAIVRTSGQHYLSVPENFQRESDIIFNTLIYLGITISFWCLVPLVNIQWITHQKDLFSETLKKSGFNIRSLPAGWLNDEFVILAIVKLFGKEQFQYASQGLRDNENMVRRVALVTTLR